MMIDESLYVSDVMEIGMRLSRLRGCYKLVM